MFLNCINKWATQANILKQPPKNLHALHWGNITEATNSVFVTPWGADKQKTKTNNTNKMVKPWISSDFRDQ